MYIFIRKIVFKTYNKRMISPKMLKTQLYATNVLHRDSLPAQVILLSDRSIAT